MLLMINKILTNSSGKINSAGNYLSGSMLSYEYKSNDLSIILRDLLW